MGNGTAYFNLWSNQEFVGCTRNLNVALAFQNKSFAHDVELVHVGDIAGCIESLTCDFNPALAEVNYKDVMRHGGDKYRPDNMLLAAMVAIRQDIHIVDYNTGRVVTDAGTRRYVKMVAWLELCDYFERNDYHNR